MDETKLKFTCARGHDPIVMVPIGQIPSLGSQIFCRACGASVWMDIWNEDEEE